MGDNRPLGMFDSGVGGLTVAREVVRQLPRESFIYYGDSAHVPYGPKPKEELKRIVFNILRTLQEKDVKLVVMACNTSSALLLEDSRQVFPFPIVGLIEPGAREAVAATRNKRVGVIGTKGTIESGAYTKAIQKIDPGIQVLGQATPEFILIVEAGIPDLNEARKIARRYLEPLKESQIDTLVLGCTHFPPLSGILQEVLGPEVKLVDPAAATVAEAAKIISQQDIAREAPEPASYEFITTGEVAQFKKVGERVFGAEITQVVKF